jgi:hypothetical protein
VTRERVKLDGNDKDNIRAKVSAPFFKLAKKIDGETTKKLALRVFREDVVPELKEVQSRFPEFWNRLNNGPYFTYETPQEPRVSRYRYYAPNRQSGTVKVPSDILRLIGGKIPELTGITVQHEYNGSTDPVITQELMKSKARPEDKEKVEKAQTLREKGARVAELLNDFLKVFTMPEQVPYSLPQLNYFMSRMDFRKRNRWESKPPMKVQKRPRVVSAPSDELRQLVMEATMLHQSLGKEMEDD